MEYKPDAALSALKVAFAALVCIVLGVWAIAESAPLWLGQPVVQPGWAVGGVRPEPIERTAFVALAALAPCLLLLWFWAFPSGRRAEVWPPMRWLLPVLAPVALIYPFISSDVVQFMFFPKGRGHRVWLPAAAIAMSLWVIVRSQHEPAKRWSLGTAVTVAVIVAIVLQILPNRLFTIDAVDATSASWSRHFDVLMFTLSQVVNGKTLLTDLPSQYGFFPEVVAPMFRMLGLSVFSLSAFFALLQIAALGTLAALLHRHVKNGPLAILTFCTVLIPTGLFLFLNGDITEAYLQYYPLRFFWPVVALLVFSIYTDRPVFSFHPERSRKAVLHGLAVLSGIAAFWNMDTGVPIILAVTATLFSRALVNRQARSAFLQALTFLGISVATLALCFVALRLKAGAPLHLGAVIEYQRLFYGYGFGMLPLPLPFHPWQSVLAVYLGGLVVPLLAWRRRLVGGVFDVLFCASLLGGGLFAYYQGRSHTFNLLMVLWPAVFTGAILADMALRSVRERTSSLATIATAFPFVFFVSMGTLALLVSTPVLLKGGFSSMSTLNTVHDPIVADEIGFMLKTRNGRSCLILSRRQGIYYATLGIASPLRGPGIIETILQRDLDALKAAALHQPLECVYLGLSPTTEPELDVGPEALIARYPIAAKSDLGTMLLLEPRKGSP